MLQGVVAVLSGIQQKQHQTITQSTANIQGSPTAEDKKELQKTIDKKFEAILAHKLDKFSRQRPADWVTAVQKMLRAYRVAFLEDDELPAEAREKGITEEMCDNLEVAVVTTAEKSLTTEAKTRLGLDHTQVSVAAFTRSG